MRIKLSDNKWKIFFCGLAFCLGAVTSCTKEPEKLSLVERALADSLYRMEVNVLRPKLDSICNAQQDSLIHVLSDSIMEERIEEIARQLERIKNVR